MSQASVKRAFAKPRVSVVVPCRNEAAHIGPFLESLSRQQTDSIDIEVLLADGMSTDGTRERIASLQRKCAYPLRLIDNPQLIASTALNAAIRAASGDIIIRMDCHTEYAPDYTLQCVRTLEKTGAGNVGGPACTRAEGWIPRAIAAAYHSRFSTGGARFHDQDFEGYVDTVTYGCWHKSTLLQLGLFDESLVRNQDDELNLRLIRSGGKIWQSRSILSWYRPRKTLSSLFRQYLQYGFWKVPVVRKHRIPGSWRHLVPGVFVLSVLMLLIVSILGLVAGEPPWAVLDDWLLLGSVTLYGAASMAASLAAAKRNGWNLLPVLPAVFLVYHVSYGIGFLSGVVYWLTKANPSAPVAVRFTELSR